jgi:hypothetical protein
MKLKSILATELAGDDCRTVDQRASGLGYKYVDGQPRLRRRQCAQGDKAMKPHSHMEEKTGVPQKAAGRKCDKKPDPTKDKNRHLASAGRQVNDDHRGPTSGASSPLGHGFYNKHGRVTGIAVRVQVCSHEAVGLQSQGSSATPTAGCRSA